MNDQGTGSVRLAHVRERMLEFEAAPSMAPRQGLTCKMMAPGDLRDTCPFVEPHELAGALWHPEDGDFCPAQLTQTLAKGGDLGQGSSSSARSPASDAP